MQNNFNNEDKVGLGLMSTITFRPFIYFLVINFFINDPNLSAELLKTILIIDKSLVEGFFNQLDEKDLMKQTKLINELLNEDIELKSSEKKNF